MSGCGVVPSCGVWCRVVRCGVASALCPVVRDCSSWLYVLVCVCVCVGVCVCAASCVCIGVCVGTVELCCGGDGAIAEAVVVRRVAGVGVWWAMLCGAKDMLQLCVCVFFMNLATSVPMMSHT